LPTEDVVVLGQAMCRPGTLVGLGSWLS
jgi:hypothetical protein